MASGADLTSLIGARGRTAQVAGPTLAQSSAAAAEANRATGPETFGAHRSSVRDDRGGSRAGVDPARTRGVKRRRRLM